VKIICGLGTAVRFAVACFVVGAVLGFLLASSWHGPRPNGVSVADPQAHVRVRLGADQMLAGDAHNLQAAGRGEVRLHGAAAAQEV
jgi:hypothetical protein